MSIVTSVAVFFALNPEEELTANDIAAKYGVVANNIGNTLRYASQKGWFNAELKQHPAHRGKKIMFYSAGPRLLKEIGQ